MITEIAESIVRDWVKGQGWDAVPEFVLERPADEAHGDYAAAFCLQLAGVARRPPRQLADELRDRLLENPRLVAVVEGIEVAGPGFLNFTLSSRAYAQLMEDLLCQGEEVGRGAYRESPHIQLEYVSVNPNGPLHVGHARYAAYGNSLDRIMRFAGSHVSTEFYINDHGRQMEMFGRSVAARYAQSFGIALDVPADGYQGDYVSDIASVIRDEVGDRWVSALRAAVCAGFDHPEAREGVRFFRACGCGLMLEGMRAELASFGVTFDNWFSETTLHEQGRVQRVIDRLLAAGEAYREGDAIWLRTTTRGDDKDRVLIRSNEQPTYFAADIAYHEDKLERGFDYLINIWGADHHGYVPRMKAAVEILAGRPGVLEVIIGQLVNLPEEGELRQMSTRRGEMVTLAELVKAVGVDAARFFLVMRSHDQTLDLDLDLARRRSQDNPVYYVQYAHARIASILRNLPPELSPGVIPGAGVFASGYERALIKRLEAFPAVVQESAARRAPHRIASYAQDLAADFHAFYKHCRVIGAEPAISSSRLALCVVSKRVVARCLDLLGVAAPETM